MTKDGCHHDLYGQLWNRKEELLLSDILGYVGIVFNLCPRLDSLKYTLVFSADINLVYAT